MFQMVLSLHIYTDMVFFFFFLQSDGVPHGFKRSLLRIRYQLSIYRDLLSQRLLHSKDFIIAACHDKINFEFSASRTIQICIPSLIKSSYCFLRVYQTTLIPTDMKRPIVRWRDDLILFLATES